MVIYEFIGAKLNVFSIIMIFFLKSLVFFQVPVHCMYTFQLVGMYSTLWSIRCLVSRCMQDELLHTRPVLSTAYIVSFEGGGRMDPIDEP